MTQQEFTAALSTAAPALPVVPKAPSKATSACITTKSLHNQMDEAMKQLMAVSSQFKDLTGQDRNVSTREETIAMMEHYLQRLQLSEAVQTQLSVIHIAGTKGKGSTCAMVERILREAGYKTGLFTSPHLISPCERFRINGKPIAEATFLHHFRAVWNGLESTAHQCEDYPPMAWFFRFLTLMALHLFLEEQVDVVILEVGLGGRLDATNVIKKPVVCGITTLDLDHTRVLGNSLDRIAYAKAGIFKPGVPAFTVQQEPTAMDMIEHCARETGNPVYAVSTIDQLCVDGSKCVLGMQGDYQRTNAALAVALATTWLQQRERGTVSLPLDFSTALTPVVQKGLANAFWPARSHVMPDPKHAASYFIDGAHTMRSLECCSTWFDQSARMSTKRALIFTIHHERNVASIIHPLLRLSFDRVYFCPTSACRPSLAKVLTFTEALQSAGWDQILSRYSAQDLAALDAMGADGSLKWQFTLASIWKALRHHFVGDDDTAIVAVKSSVRECIEDLRAASRLSTSHCASSSPLSSPLSTDDDDDVDGQDDAHWSVLVTGSLYLSGEALDYLDWKE